MSAEFDQLSLHAIATVQAEAFAELHSLRSVDVRNNSHIGTLRGHRMLRAHGV